jgi:predicted nucleic acid-binding protein
MTLAASLGCGILDANGIIGLAKAGCLDVLPRLFDSVRVSPLVVREVLDAVSRAELSAALADWLAETEPSPAAMQRVPMLRRATDRSILALALDCQPCVLITGDRAIVSKAKQLSISTMTAPDVIQLLAEEKLIAVAKPCLDEMRQRGFGVPEAVYQAILRSLGE